MSLIPWRRRESLVPATFDFDDLFRNFWEKENLVSHLPEAFRERHVPAVNVAETEDTFCITMDCPGLDEKDFQVEAMGNQLVISGERKWEEEKEGKEFRRVESQYGKFQRSIALPTNARVEPDAIEATYKKGVLSVTVPKVQKTPAAKIAVTAG